MAAKPCPQCGHPLAPSAAKCQNCGHQPFLLPGCFIIASPFLLLFFLFIIGCL